MRASSSIVAAVLALAGCRSDVPAPGMTRVATPGSAPPRPQTSAPAAPALVPAVPDAPDYRDLVRALAEGVEVDEPRTTVELADQARPAITGIVRDLETGEPLAGATVIAVSPTIPGEQVVITDENGNYILDALPGTYTVTLYYMYQTLVETDVAVAEGHVTHLTEAMPTAPLRMPESPPADDLESIPVPGRTFEAALGAAAGSQDDGLGVSFSSHCGLENVYVVDSDDEPGSIELEQ